MRTKGPAAQAQHDDKAKDARERVEGRRLVEQADWQRLDERSEDQRQVMLGAARANSEDQRAARRFHKQLLLSADDLYELGIRFSRAQRHKLIAAGAFPKPVQLSAQRSAWVADEIYAWLEARKDERAADAQTAA